MKSKFFIQTGMNIHARVLAFLAVLAMTSYSSSAQPPPPRAPRSAAAPAEQIEGFHDHLIAGQQMVSA